MMDLLPYAVAWAVLALVVLGLAIMRRGVAAKEDDYVHLSGDASVISTQAEVAKKLEVIDKWGKGLTVLLVVTGLALATVWGMRLWDASATAGFK